MDTCRSALDVRLHPGDRAPPQHRDYALPGKFLVPFLTGRSATRDVVAIYNRSSGIRFPMPTMEQKAKDLLGLDKPAQPGQPGLRGPRRCHRTAVGPGLRVAESSRGCAGPARKAHACRRRVTVILEYAETLLPAADLPMMTPDDRNLLVTLLRRAPTPALNAAGNFAFLLVQNLTDLHLAPAAPASSGYYAIEVPLPDRVVGALSSSGTSKRSRRHPISERMNSPTSPPA